MSSTHPQNMKLFEGFAIGRIGTEDIVYGKGSGNSSPDKY